jgi:hypothetical protein
MAYSLYEIKDYQDVAKPSDLMSENLYLQDGYSFTHPENKYVDNRPKEDNEIQDVYYDDQSYNYNPSNWDDQQSYLVKAQSVIAQYRLENDFLGISWDNGKKGHSKTAVTISDLMRATSVFSRQRAPRTNVKLVKDDPKSLRYVYLVRGYEEWSDGKGHQVIIQLAKSNKTNSLNALDVKVSCSCPFWKYRGPDFNSNKNNYLEGKPYSNLKFPSVTDPAQENLICKHVYAVGTIIDKIMVKYNLNTQKEVDNILSTLSNMKESFLPQITIEGVEDLVNRLKPTERKDLEKIIKQFKIEKKQDRKDRIFNNLLSELKDRLDVQEKPFLLKLFHDLKNIFNFKKKEDTEEKKELERIEEEKVKIEEEEKADDSEEDISDDLKNKDNRSKKPEKLNRRKKNLKRLLRKKSSLDSVSYKISSIVNAYLENIEELEYGQL